MSNRDESPEGDETPEGSNPSDNATAEEQNGSWPGKPETGPFEPTQPGSN